MQTNIFTPKVGQTFDDPKESLLVVKYYHFWEMTPGYPTLWVWCWKIVDSSKTCKILLYFGKWQMRHVPTKWETSRKISFQSYNQIHVVQTLSFKMICYMSWLLPYLGSKTYYFLEKFLCFLLIFEMFNESYLL